MFPWPAVVNYTDVDRTSSQWLPSSSKWYWWLPGSWSPEGLGQYFFFPWMILPLPQRLSAIDRLLASSVFLQLPAPASLPPLLGSPESLAFILSLPLNAACTDGPVIWVSIPAFRTMPLLIGFWILALQGLPVQNSLEGC